MKKRTIITLFAITTSIFIGCGSSSSGNKNSDDEIKDNSSNDIILKKGESITCTKKTSFSVEPADDNKPTVSFSKDTESGDISIILDKASKGFVKIIGCTKK